MTYDRNHQAGLHSVLICESSCGISEIEGKAAKGSGERVRNERVSNLRMKFFSAAP
jgi:hypothetical protein